MRLPKTAHSFLPNNVSTSLRLLLVLLVSALFVERVEAQNKNITETVLYSGITQGDKSYNFYTMQISTRYFTGS